MTLETAFSLHTSVNTPSSVCPSDPSHKPIRPVQEPRPKPDWLLILMGILVLLTLLVAWLADIPVLFR